MEKPAKQCYTAEEYLELEESADYKSEYYKGDIFAMAGASVNHNRIVGNLHTALNLALSDSKCEAFMSDLRIYVEAVDLFTYPDITVVCDQPKFYKNRDDTITNPLVIFEVLSESTKNYDRGDKFEFYRTLPSLQEYVLVDQSKVHVEHFYLTAERHWLLTDYNSTEDVLKLVKIDFAIPVKEIYQRVSWGATE